jgi:hypothetical protein
MALEPQSGVQWVQTFGLFSTAEPGTLQVNPTMAAGDFLLYQDNVLIGNLATLPTSAPAGSRLCLLTVTAGEMVGLRVDIVGHDPDATWGDIHIPLRLAQNAGDARMQVAAAAALDAENGANFTAIPWNAAWDAEVQSEVDDALVAHRLDELLNADSDIDGAAPPTVGSVFHELLTKTAGGFTYDQTTDSLEASRDKLTDIEVDTQDIQTRLPSTLSAGNMKADAVALGGSTAAVDNLMASALVIYRGTVTGAATTTTLIDSGLTQVGTDHWKGKILIFGTTELKYQWTNITAYNPATKQLTFMELTEVPAGGATFVIL